MGALSGEGDAKKLVSGGRDGGLSGVWACVGVGVGGANGLCRGV